MSIKNRLQKMGIDSKQLRSNTQQVGYKLLMAEGSWVPVKELGVPNAQSRARDLRKETYGQFRVGCVVEGGDTLYRITKTSVRNAQLSKLFGV